MIRSAVAESFVGSTAMVAQRLARSIGDSLLKREREAARCHPVRTRKVRVPAAARSFGIGIDVAQQDLARAGTPVDAGILDTLEPRVGMQMHPIVKRDARRVGRVVMDHPMSRTGKRRIVELAAVYCHLPPRRMSARCHQAACRRAVPPCDCIAFLINSTIFV